MEGVQFQEEDPLLAKQTSSLVEAPKKTGFVTKIAVIAGLAKDDREAQLILGVFTIFVVLASAGYYLIGNNVHATRTVTAAEVQANLYPNGTH